MFPIIGVCKYFIPLKPFSSSNYSKSIYGRSSIALHHVRRHSLNSTRRYPISFKILSGQSCQSCTTNKCLSCSTWTALLLTKPLWQRPTLADNDTKPINMNNIEHFTFCLQKKRDSMKSDIWCWVFSTTTTMRIMEQQWEAWNNHVRTTNWKERKHGICAACSVQMFAIECFGCVLPTMPAKIRQVKKLNEDIFALAIKRKHKVIELHIYHISSIG